MSLSTQFKQFLCKPNQLNSTYTMTQALEFSNTAVVGAGAMGRGIAQMMLEAGAAVTLYDTQAVQLDAARDGIAKGIAKRVEKNAYAQSAADDMLARLRTNTELTALAGCDLVVEAIVEKLAVKQAVLTQVQAIVGAQCVIASNTSSLSVTAIAAGLPHPTMVAGWHFFNPVPLMKVAEVIAAARTTAGITDKLAAFTRRFGHTAVVCQDTPGFIVNHAGRAYGTEALAILREGVADVATIDAILRDAAGFKMGPFELMDLTALDVSHPVMESIHSQYYQDDRYRPSNLAAQRLAAGLLGRKTGEGFYSYAEGKATNNAVPAAPVGTLPQRVWFAPMEPATRDWLVKAALAAGVVVEHSGSAPSDDALVMCSPIGQDVSSQVALHRLPAERTVGVDGFIPLDSVKRVTLMRNPAIRATSVGAACALLASTGKAVSVINDSCGFVTQRVLVMVVAIGCEIAQQGIANPTDIDNGVRLGLGYPQGPLAWGDALGTERVAQTLAALRTSTGDSRYRPALWLSRRATLGLSLLHGEG
jgi:3-hydroxybutyryl-CoA dehydrogenase